MMDEHRIEIPVKRFLLTENCPAAWKGLDLYLFRDETVVFYVGQSHLAFGRVWDHLISGFKGHSIVGRFVWCNWPASMNFIIELLSSQSDQFRALGNDLSAAEQQLIRHCSPCFNVSQNIQPTALPLAYQSPNAPLRCGRSLNKLIHQCERTVMAEDSRRWVQEIG